VGGDTLMTKEEKKEYDRIYREKNKERLKAQRNQPHIKVKYKERSRLRHLKNIEVRDKLIKLHGDKCHDCDYTYHNNVYDFHHRVPKDKSFSLGSKAMSKPWEVIMIEASKTDMLCRNCHAARHILMKEEDEQREIGKSNQ
jgi:hypothetical protein